MCRESQLRGADATADGARRLTRACTPGPSLPFPSSLEAASSSYIYVPGPAFGRASRPEPDGQLGEQRAARRGGERTGRVTGTGRDTSERCAHVWVPFVARFRFGSLARQQLADETRRNNRSRCRRRPSPSPVTCKQSPEPSPMNESQGHQPYSFACLARFSFWWWLTNNADLL